MEKYSAYRDPGTGIQASSVLKYVPPLGSETLIKFSLPLAYTLGVIRTTLVLLLALLYTVLVDGICLLLTPIPPLQRLAAHVLTALLARFALFILGLLWIPTETVTRKRGRLAESKESWSPGAGDLIVSNWISWVELLWLSYRFNPIFVLPVPSESPSAPSAPAPQATGRRTGTGSAAVTPAANRPSTKRIQIAGFRKVSLLSLICFTGRVPVPSHASPSLTLEDIRGSAGRPVVVFPECTTSNGRGLLRFADVFKGRPVPTKGYSVFVMCARCDPPTALSPSLSLSIPTALNPLAHLFTLASSFKPLTLSVRLLAPSEGPSAPMFMPSEIVGPDVGEDTLSASCAGLIAQLGKFKKLSLGWEDKVTFLEFYREKRR
ncbi:hypothetical protein OF83DRAFT_1168093 [Amylostereum chailletii]|nr:hypothetical protein OF83DRAFT_1168093 [Amylostereum chailletii]